MNYDIKISNNYEGIGKLELSRVAFLSTHIKSIAQKALLLQLFGYSKVLLPNKYKKYLNIFLTSKNAENSETFITLDSDTFQELSIQLDAFRDKSSLQKLTPVSLVIKTFQAALNDQEDKNLLDEPLIDELIKFKKFFQNEEEQILLSNRGTIPEVSISERGIDKIEVLYKSIPQPEKIMLNGIIDEMRFSKKQLVLVTEDRQRVVVIPPTEETLTNIKEFFGLEITLAGMAHYKAGGQLSCVELESFGKPGKADRFFSKKPEKKTIQQQITIQLKEGKKNNPLDEIIGKWPGDETDAEFEQMLKSLD